MTPDERAEYVRRVVDQAPPLSPALRDRLAALLRPSSPRPAAPGAARSRAA